MGFRVNSLFNISVEFPDDFDCALEFPHFICKHCDLQMHNFSTFIKRAQMIDTELRNPQILSKTEVMDRIEANLTQNILFQDKLPKEKVPRNRVSNEEANEVSILDGL